MRKILAFIMAAMLMSTGLTALADSSASEPQAVCETLANGASEAQAESDAPAEDVTVPESLDMMVIAEQNVFEFSFMKWYSTPDEVMAVFGLNEDNCVTEQTDNNNMTIAFDYPSALDESNARVQLAFERIGGELALTSVSQSEILDDLQAVNAYTEAISARAEDMFNAEAIRKSVYNTFKAVSGMAEQLAERPGATLMKNSTFSAYFTDADTVERQVNFTMEICPAANSTIISNVQDGYCATYTYFVKENPILAIFG